MREQPIDEQQVGRFTVKVYPDPEPTNPREDWDEGTIMLCKHPRYNFGDYKQSFVMEAYQEYWYDFGDFHDGVDLVETLLREHPGTEIMPLFLYEHGGITMSVEPFSCQWDSGQVGIIYMTREMILNEYGKGGKRVTAKMREQARKLMAGEVETYDDYLRGNVYGFVVEDENGEHVDSCWGFFGDYDDAMEEGVASAEWEEKQLVEAVTKERAAVAGGQA